MPEKRNIQARFVFGVILCLSFYLVEVVAVFCDVWVIDFSFVHLRQGQWMDRKIASMGPVDLGALALRVCLVPSRGVGPAPDRWESLFFELLDCFLEGRRQAF